MPFSIKDKRIIIILIIIIGFALYAFNFHNRLFWDDDDWIVNNPFVHSFSWQNFKFIFSHDTLAGIGLRSNYYRPFLFLTFMANYIIGGAAPFFYHLANNFIHIFNAVLIFILLDKFLGKRWVAGATALLFLIHPLQTEAVTYISGRGDPLSVLLMLLALFSFLYNRRLLSFLFSILAILTRETAFLFPFYLIVFLTAFVYQDKFWLSIKKSFVKSLPYFGISLVYGISRLTFLNFQNTLNFFIQSNAYSEHLIYRLYTFLHVIVVYLGLIFVPINLHMERDVLVNTSFYQWPVWLGGIFLAALILILFYLYKKQKPHFKIWFFAWGFFFINLAPTSGIFPINALLYEHWLYLSLFGFFTLLVFYLEIILNFLKLHARLFFYTTIFLFSAYIAFLGVQTIRRNILWGKTDKFYEEILKYEPQNARVLNNLANYYSDHGRLSEAENLYQRAIDANDFQPAPYYNLGNILRDRNDYVRAAELYKKAIEISPSFPYAYTNLGSLYAKQGNLTEALKYLKQVTLIESSNPLAYYNVAEVEAALGNKKEAINFLHNALKYSADNPNMQAGINKFLETINK